MGMKLPRVMGNDAQPLKSCAAGLGFRDRRENCCHLLSLLFRHITSHHITDSFDWFRTAGSNPKSEIGEELNVGQTTARFGSQMSLSSFMLSTFNSITSTLPSLVPAMTCNYTVAIRGHTERYFFCGACLFDLDKGASNLFVSSNSFSIFVLGTRCLRPRLFSTTVQAGPHQIDLPKFPRISLDHRAAL